MTIAVRNNQLKNQLKQMKEKEMKLEEVIYVYHRKGRHVLITLFYQISLPLSSINININCKIYLETVYVIGMNISQVNRQVTLKFVN